MKTSKFWPRVAVFCLFSLLYLQANAEITIDNSQAVFPFDIDTDPAFQVPGDIYSADLGSSNLFIGRQIIVSPFVFPASGSLTIDAILGGINDYTSLYVDGQTVIGRFDNTTGTLNVTGDGSYSSALFSSTNIISLGENGTGILNISNGGVVNATQVRMGVPIFSTVQGTGEIHIDGFGSELNADQLLIGSSSNGAFGTVDVSGGGLISLHKDFVYPDSTVVGTGQLAVTENSSVVVTGFDSTITTDILTVGNNNDPVSNPSTGTASLSVLNGANVEATRGSNVGHVIGAGSRGEILVSGDSYLSYWSDRTDLNSGALLIGASTFNYNVSNPAASTFTPGDGTLTIDNGGFVEVYGDVFVGGAQNISNPEAMNTINPSPTEPVPAEPASTGLLDIKNNSAIQANTIYVGENGTLKGDAAFIFADVMVQAGGTLAPGNSPGTMYIAGDLNLSGLLEIEIAGTGPGEFDQLVVSGNYDLGGGNIVFSLLGGVDAGILDTLTLGDIFLEDLLGTYTPVQDFSIFNDVNLSLNTGAVLSGLMFDGADGSLSLSPVVVPEPATFWLFALGLLLLLAWHTGRPRQYRM